VKCVVSAESQDDIKLTKLNEMSLIQINTSEDSASGSTENESTADCQVENAVLPCSNTDAVAQSNEVEMPLPPSDDSVSGSAENESKDSDAKCPVANEVLPPSEDAASGSTENESAADCQVENAVLPCSNTDAVAQSNDVEMPVPPSDTSASGSTENESKDSDAKCPVANEVLPPSEDSASGSTENESAADCQVECSALPCSGTDAVAQSNEVEMPVPASEDSASGSAENESKNSDIKCPVANEVLLCSNSDAATQSNGVEIPGVFLPPSEDSLSGSIENESQNSAPNCPVANEVLPCSNSDTVELNNEVEVSGIFVSPRSVSNVSVHAISTADQNEGAPVMLTEASPAIAVGRAPVQFASREVIWPVMAFRSLDALAFWNGAEAMKMAGDNPGIKSAKNTDKLLAYFLKLPGQTQCYWIEADQFYSQAQNRPLPPNNLRGLSETQVEQFKEALMAYEIESSMLPQYLKEWERIERKALKKSSRSRMCTQTEEIPNIQLENKQSTDEQKICLESKSICLVA